MANQGQLKTLLIVKYDAYKELAKSLIVMDGVNHAPSGTRRT